MAHYLCYIRRSYKRAASGASAGSADVSDETQLAVCLSLLPPGSTHEVISDSGGHQSGATADREGYQRLIAKVRAGGVAGIAVYDLSRLARNVRLMSNLLHELDRQSVAILAGNLPNTRHDSAVGRFMFNMLVSAAQFQRDLDSERMVAQMRQAFLEGAPRGLDPFGFRTDRDEAGRVVHPRKLVVVEHEAEVVRRTFRMLASQPFSAIADTFNRDGTQHRAPRAWTTAAVKDLWRRREVYRGNVSSRRGLEVRPGTHEAILDEATFREAVAGVERRKHQKGPRPPSGKRDYLLRGLVHCTGCSSRMRGDARLSRGKAWRYYVCPVSDGRSALLADDGALVECHARRVPADAAEKAVLGALAMAALPESSVEAAREELRQRLRAPAPGSTDKERERLRAHIAKLADLFAWDHITEAEYRKRRADAEAQLTEISEDDRLGAFERQHAVVRSLPQSLPLATPAQLQELIVRFVERVDTADRRVVGVTWTPQARPFFAPVPDGTAAWVLAPPDGLTAPTACTADPLEWYAVAV